MIAELPNDWPKTLTTNVVSPLTYLKNQAKLVFDFTGGVLMGDVRTTTTAEGLTSHRLEFIAPLLKGERLELLTITHNLRKPYPCTITSNVARFEDWDEMEADIVASTYDDLRGYVRRILASNDVQAAMQSLIVRSNEEPLPNP